MVTSLYSLGKVNGAEMMVAGWLVCAAVYWVCVLYIRQSRSGSGLRRAALAFLAAEVVTDLCWAVYYFPGGVYVNRGVGSVYGALIWPLALCVVGILAALYNRERA